MSKTQEFTITPDNLISAIELYIRTEYKDKLPDGNLTADIKFMDNGDIKVFVSGEK